MNPLRTTIVVLLAIAVVLLLAGEAWAGGPNRIPLTTKSAQASYSVDYGASNLRSAGHNNFGQLANGSSSPNPVGNLQAVQTLTTSHQVSLGADHGVAWTQNDTVVYVWGSNRYGQLGRAQNSGTTTPHPTPIRISLPGRPRVVTAAAGRQCTFVIDSAGRLWSFGYNRYGELGHSSGIGSETANHVPAEVELPDSLVRWSWVSSGGNHTLAGGMVPSGNVRVYSFGRNNLGQLGRALNSGTDSPNPSPAPVAIALPVTSAGTGEDFSFCFTSAGVYTFGSNQFGQLGRSANSGTTNPNHTPAVLTPPSGITSWSTMSAGAFHVVATGSTGSDVKAFSWGSNRYGQLGRSANSGTTTPNPVPTEVAKINSEAWIQVVAGYQHTLASTGAMDNPRFSACGLNQWGELANPAGIGTMNPNPAWVAFGTPVSAVGDGEELPWEFTLEQNFPNPFNPSTMIRYTLARSAAVSLRVFNLVGEEVATLVDEYQGPGTREVVFDATGLASGVYLYELRAGTLAATKKLVLLR
jgi:alpha-tubulin suppressor-like RCC1 family protein